MATGLDITSKVALVTGGGSGIGRGAALSLARRGVSVMVADIDAAAGGRLVGEAGNLPGKIAATACDVADPEQVRAAVEQTVRVFGGLDYLHANAGIVLFEPFLESTLENWHRQLDVNLHGVFYACRYAAPEMVKRGGGAIVITSSVRAVATNPLHAAYTASKGAVSALTVALATELAAHNIRVNAVLPGAIDTPMNDLVARLFFAGNAKALSDAVAPKVPMGRMGRPDELGNVVAFLLSEEASYINGALLPVDGGMLALL